MSRRLLPRSIGGLAWLLALPAVGLVALAVRFVRCFRAEIACFHPARGPIARPADERGLEGLREAHFTSSTGDALSGWYVPSRNRAAVVLVHGSGANRLSLLPEARILGAAGFGALLFDMPGHGESRGRVRWGAPERAAVRAAIDWMGMQADVDPGRLGAMGFSMGGLIVAQVAPNETRIRAVVLAAAPPNAAEQTRWEYRGAGRVGQLAALAADRWGGMRFDEPQPIAVVRGIAPRPLLVMGGEEDAVVPTTMIDQLYRAAGDPKERFIVPNAGHGGYDEAAGADYRDRLVAFFTRSLLADADGIAGHDGADATKRGDSAPRASPRAIDHGGARTAAGRSFANGGGAR